MTSQLNDFIALRYYSYPSMEECESICNRMGILVNGGFLCLGNLQHLRDKFGYGYTLIIKLQRSAFIEKPEVQQERIEKLKTFINQTFPESVLKDQHENLLNVQVKAPNFKWSRIFGSDSHVSKEIRQKSRGSEVYLTLFSGSGE